MEWPLTIALAVAGLALLGASVWKTSRPRADSARARWVPWRFLILLAGAIIAFAVIHAVNLMGFHTGGNSRPY